MNHKKLRVGVIGGSVNNGWAKGTHIPAIQQLSELELAAVGTTNMESAEKSARAFKAPHAFADANELAQHPDVDLVTVSVKVYEHLEAVKAAVQNGKHVYCEWPLGANTAEAMGMQQLAATHKVHHTIGLQARQAPEINYLKDLLAEGYVGKVLSANMRIYTAMMAGSVNQSSTYLLNKTLGGNLFTILGGHSLDALTYLLGDFEALSAINERHYKEANVIDTGEVLEKTTDDQIMVHGKLKSGSMANIHIQGGVKHRSGVFLEIFGEKGTILLQAPNSNGHIQFGGYELLATHQVEQEQPSMLEALTVPDRYYRVPETIKKEGGVVLNVAQAYRNFARDIQEETFNMPTFQDAVKIHQLLDTIEKAAKTGERQYL